MKKNRGLIYGVLVTLLIVMGVWWVYFLTTESNARADIERQKLTNDRLHAVFLIQSNPAVMADPEGTLGKSFPNLIFRRTQKGLDVLIDPVILKTTEDEPKSKRMF